MKPLIVIASIQARPGRENDLEQALRDLVAPTRHEPGCIRYDLHRSQDRPGRFLFYEVWTDRAHLEEHLRRPHLQAFLARVPELVEGEPELTFWEQVD
ncbi:MAG: antibiotic biosynthesis monooxygenase [Limisphaera sp.]|nr:MAG: antibiotic biosynthesis monooxygenase [Limisphaera sp.]